MKCAFFCENEGSPYVLERSSLSALVVVDPWVLMRACKQHGRSIIKAGMGHEVTEEEATLIEVMMG